MSKRGYISRYMLLIKKLKAKPFSSFEDIQSYLQRQAEQLSLQDDTLIIGFSLRTLQRDIKEIRTLFGIDIVNDRKRKGYHIVENNYDSQGFERMIEAFDVFQSIQRNLDLNQFIGLESRQPAGTEHLYGLLHAIRNNLLVTFDYYKFWQGKAGPRTVAPYLLKEFRNRWYLIAVKTGEQQLKSFALDRVSNLQINQERFHRSMAYNTEELFQHAFGIMSGDGQPPQEVILSFSAFQGNYIKTLPLHHSQQILIDNGEEVRVSIRVYLTHDLLMELRSFGEDVEVIAPPVLRHQIKHSLKDALGYYTTTVADK